MKKQIFNIAFFVILIVGTMYFLLRDQEISELWNCIISANKFYLFIGLFLMFIFVSSESIIIHYLMNSLSYAVKLIQCLKYSFVGFFVSLITPSSTGGQPAQVYFMKLDDVSVSVSSLVLLVVTIAYKIALFIVGFIMMFANLAFTLEHIKGIEIILIWGIGVNIVVITASLLMIFKQSLAKRLIGKCILFLGKLKLLKNHDAKLKKLIISMYRYEQGAKYLRENKLVFFNTIMISVLQRLAYFAVTFVVYKSFGLKGYSALDIMTLQMLITVAVDNLPLPGGLGASEGIFKIFFLEIFTGVYLTAGLLLSRGLNYYLIVLVGGLVTALAGFFQKKTKQSIYAEVSKFDMLDELEKSEEE